MKNYEAPKVKEELPRAENRDVILNKDISKISRLILRDPKGDRVYNYVREILCEEDYSSNIDILINELLFGIKELKKQINFHNNAIMIFESKVEFQEKVIENFKDDMKVLIDSFKTKIDVCIKSFNELENYYDNYSKSHFVSNFSSECFRKGV